MAGSKVAPKINTCDPQTVAVLSMGIWGRSVPSEVSLKYSEHLKRAQVIKDRFCGQNHQLTLEQALNLAGGFGFYRWQKVDSSSVQTMARRSYESAKAGLDERRDSYADDKSVEIMTAAAKLAGITDSQVKQDIREIASRRFADYLPKFIDFCKTKREGAFEGYMLTDYVGRRNNLYLLAKWSGVSEQELIKKLNEAGAGEKDFHGAIYSSAAGAAVLFAKAGCFDFSIRQMRLVSQAAKALGTPDNVVGQVRREINQIKGHVEERKPDRPGKVISCQIEGNEVRVDSYWPSTSGGHE